MELKFENIVVDYPATNRGEEPLRALERLSLSVGEGEAIAVIGPSGCGKSTLLRLASGLQTPTEGQVVAGGAAVKGPVEGTSLILQDFGLLPWKNVYHNAELGLKVHGVEASERRKRTERALEQVGLKGFEKSYPKELSGGMQQRLALARAIAMDTKTLLMDEPLSALDALLREELQETLLNLWKEDGYTQVLVTHSIEEAALLGQRIVVMAPRPGRVVGIVENPDMGSVEYRGKDQFFRVCGNIRELLAGGLKDGDANA